MDSLIISKFAVKNNASNNHIIIGDGFDNSPNPIGYGFDNSPNPYLNPLNVSLENSHGIQVSDGFYSMKASIGVSGGFNSSDGCTEFNGHITHDNGHGTTINFDGSTSKCGGDHNNTSVGGSINYKDDNGSFGVELHGGNNKAEGNVKFDYKW